MRRSTRFISLAFGVIAVAATVGGVAPSTPASAATYSMHVVSPIAGRIGIDGIYSPDDGNGYDVTTCAPGQPSLGWDAAGNLQGTTTIPDRKAGPLVNVRFEMYPGTPCGTYDAWGNVGGVQFETGPGSRNLGTITMPVAGQGGAFRIDGNILSSSPVGASRVLVDAFQIETGMQQNGVVEYGAFGTSQSRGNIWTAGVGWTGRYIMFVTDTATGNKVTALIDIAPGGVPDIDLDAICFGFDTCNYLAGGPGNSAGTFHATAPTRILDTRTFTGITNGPVRTGDGRHPSPDPITRRDETANHDLQVTGLNGIPASGVSAVLLNVTAVGAGAPGPGFMSVIPKPPRVGDVFNDQGSYGAFPNTSNLNLENADPTPNLVLARVGAGGKIRLYNYLGPTHVIADVAGWFGTGGAHTDGTGFTGVVPSRLLDSRLGIGTPAPPVRRGRDPQPQGGGRRRGPGQRRERRRQRHDGRLAGLGLRHRVPDGRRPAQRVERQHHAGRRAGEHVGRQGRHRRADQPVRRRDQLGRDRRRARQLRPRWWAGHHDHAGALRRQPVGQRHGGAPVRRERGAATSRSPAAAASRPTPRR